MSSGPSSRAPCCRCSRRCTWSYRAGSRGRRSTACAPPCTGSRPRLHVDGGARHHVLVVVGADTSTSRANFLRTSTRRAMDRDAAALVTVIEHVGAVFRQHAGERATAMKRRPRRARASVLTRAAFHAPCLLHISCIRSRRRRCRWRRARLRALRTRGRDKRSRPGCGRTT